MYLIRDEGNIYSIYNIIKQCWIPKNLNNSDYQEYLKWVDEGNIPNQWSSNEEEV